MAKATFETPRIPEYPAEIPVVVEDAMAHSRPFVAAPEHQEAFGLPGQLVEDWHDRVIACFLGTGDPKNMPVARQDLLRKVYRRPRRAAGQGRAAPDAGVPGNRRAPPRHPHRRHLRDLQEPVQKGAAVLRHSRWTGS